MNNYVRPEKISSDMGGTDNQFDDRLSQELELLGTLSFKGYSKVLDIGVGKAQIAKWFSSKGFEVIGTGLEIESYEINSKELEVKYGIKIIECNIEKMPFADNSFDIIVMSHVLEHCYNVGIALQEVKRLLAPEGIVCVFVPTHDDFVCSGHISMGWNLGQLMYVLLLNGFRVKDGKFCQYGSNVSAVIKKNNCDLPLLRGDRGDIHILDKEGYLPLPIISKDKLNDNFFGRIGAINWDIDSLVKKNRKKKSTVHKLLMLILPTIPNKVIYFFAVRLYSFSRMIAVNMKVDFFQSPN